MTEVATLVSGLSNSDLHDVIEHLSKKFGENKAFTLLADLAGYKRMPPTIEEFITGDKYLGKFMREGAGIYPAWFETLKKIYPHPLYSPYDQIILTGAIGQGKSFCAVVGMLYDICRMLHMKDPHRLFMMAPGKPLVFAIFNTTLSAADSVLMTMAVNMIESSPYFRHEMVKHLKRKPKNLKVKVNSTVKIGKFIQIKCSSRDSHIRGEDVVSGILSELNFQGQVKKDQAINNYNELDSRIDSRFKLGEDFDLPGRCWVDSSRKDETGEVEKIIKKSRRDPKTLITEYTQWDVLGPANKKVYKYLKYKSDKQPEHVWKRKSLKAGAMFELFIGDPKRDPFVISKDNKEKLDKDHVLLVPIEHKTEFEENMFTKLRDLAGIATWSTFKFVFQERFILESCTLPITGMLKQIIDLPYEHQNGTILDYLKIEEILDKKSSWYVHMDYAPVNDRTGLGFTRNAGLIDIAPDAEYTEQLQRLCHYETALVLPIIRQPGKEVPISKIEDFIIALKRMGYHIAKFTADMYQSKHSIQVLSDRYGIPTEHRSVDRERDPYDLWKRLMQERVQVEGKVIPAWRGPNHPLLIKEFKELVDLGKKIDHPTQDQGSEDDKPSKDQADGVVGSLYECYHNSTSRRVLAAAHSEYFKQQEAAKPVVNEKDRLRDLAKAQMLAHKNRNMT